jgi:hypothetical protein
MPKRIATVLIGTVPLVATALLVTGGGESSLPQQPVRAEEPAAVWTSSPGVPVPIDELPGRNAGEVLKLISPDEWAKLSPSRQEELLNKRFGIDFPPVGIDHLLRDNNLLDQYQQRGPWKVSPLADDGGAIIWEVTLANGETIYVDYLNWRVVSKER